MDKLKILLIEPNESMSDIITKSLQNSFDAEVIIYKTSTEAIDALKKGDSFSLILARNISADESNQEVDTIAVHLLNAIYDLSLKTPLIVIGQFEHALKKYALVSERLRIEEINRLVLKALGLKREDFERLKLPDYVPFLVRHFYLMNNSPCDVYIKLVKKAGDEYVKRLKPNETFSRDDLKKYEEFGVSDLYILKEEYDLFLNSLFTQSLSSLKKSRSLEESVEVIGDSYVLSSELMLTLGITPITITLVDQTINLMKTQIQKTDKIGTLLRKLLDNKMSYSYRHSYLISALSYTLLPKMEWGTGDQQNNLLEKICMVSYFHDIYLEDEKLLKIVDYAEMKSAKLSSREADIINNHAHRAATLIQGYPKLPQGLDLLIKQHHGSSNGVGFPEVLSSAISPLAIFFIVVEDFAKKILAIPDSQENLAQSMREALAPLKEKYQLPSYRKIVTELDSLLNPKK